MGCPHPSVCRDCSHRAVGAGGGVVPRHCSGSEHLSPKHSGSEHLSHCMSHWGFPGWQPWHPLAPSPVPSWWHPWGAGLAASSMLTEAGLIFHKNRIRWVNRRGCSLILERGAGAGVGLCGCWLCRPWLAVLGLSGFWDGESLCGWGLLTCLWFAASGCRAQGPACRVTP